MTRREFLAATAALPALAGARALAAPDEPSHIAPYLALQKFILPGSDEFPEEKRAFEIRAALERALHANELPVQPLGSVRRAHFYPLPDGVVRFEIAGEHEGKLYHRVGSWKLEWRDGKIVSLTMVEEHIATADEPYFRDVSAAVFAHTPSFDEQLLKGVPYWRARLDPASGIDIYGSNGVAVGDIDNDGADEIYVCQPGGLPN
ncbi:MAG TPA: hypothetical protein VMF91_27770, partial [Bryobacteraceae bacterium]|nr:hypothetical protein [Bryobacteraceae bacterium]